MTAALSAGRPGAVFDAVTVRMRDDGTDRRARLALTYAEGTGPATVFVKGVDPDHRELIKMISGLFRGSCGSGPTSRWPWRNAIRWRTEISTARRRFAEIDCG